MHPTPSRPQPLSALRRALSFLPFVALCVACKAAPPAPDGPTTQKAQQVTVVADEQPLEYLEVITGNAPESEALPLVVAIHGLGDAPDRFQGLFKFFNVPARIIIPKAPTAHGPGFSWFPVGALKGDDVPKETTDGILKSAIRITRLMDQVAREKATLGKPIVTGFSQGGILSFAIALHHPESISMALPISGALPKSLWVKGDTKMPPIKAFHGGTDQRVPVAAARAMVKQLAEDGATAEIQLFRVGHRMNAAMRGAWAEALAAQLDVLNPPSFKPLLKQAPAPK
ncbi:MAG: alpha/beta hydrolase [Bradymonadia bacterium]